MNEIGEIAKTAVMDMAAKMKAEGRAGDYVGEDGLLRCGKCHGKKQFRGSFLEKEFIVPVACECERAILEAEEKERQRRERIEEIKRRKATCIHDRALMNATFDKDDGSLPQIASAKRYVETWDERKRNNDGLLLWGDVGCGKTFYAACIANALIEEGVSVLMTNFAKILNSLSGMHGDDKNAFISSMMSYSLLIIDDLGIERNTEYALEQVYNIVDERYKSNLPLIVTTNLSLNTLKNPPDTAHQRIYDRVLSMCVPVRFTGGSHRKTDADRRIRSCRELFIQDGN